jgi:hypothetical protein
MVPTHRTALPRFLAPGRVSALQPAMADVHRKICSNRPRIGPLDLAPKNASRDDAVSEERLGAMSLTYSEARTIRDNQMNALPVDRALNIYGALAGRSETKGARERLTRHLMKMYLAGEKDQHRLTVEGLSYLRNLDQEIDSRN